MREVCHYRKKRTEQQPRENSGRNVNILNNERTENNEKKETKFHCTVRQSHIV